MVPVFVSSLDENSATRSSRSHELLILCNREWACFRGGEAPVYSEKIMTRGQIQTAIKEGIPFLIRMADGEKYEVSEPYRIALSYVIVSRQGRSAAHSSAADDDGH